MDYQAIAVGFHLLGFALGLGGATISDLMFFRTLRSGFITEEKFAFLGALSKVIWTGLGILIISGVAIFTLIYSEQGSLPMLASPRWQAKLTLVAIILCNGLFFKFGIFPALKRLVGQKLGIDQIRPIIWRLAVSGTISIASWYGILVISQLPRTFLPPYLYFMGVYVLLLICGITVSRTVISRVVSANK